MVGDLRERPEVLEARRIVDAAGAGPLDDASCWRIGDLLVAVLQGFDPRDSGEPKRQRELILSALSLAIGSTTARLRDYWRFSVLYPTSMRVQDKSWNEHRMAAMRSAAGRNRYDIALAVRLLSGEADATDLVDPFVGKDLTSQQRERARRIWRNREDFDDAAVVRAVVEELRGRKKKGLASVASAAHARAQQKIRELEELARAADGDNAIQILNKYHLTMLRATDATYHLKSIVSDLPPGPTRASVKSMIEGSVYVASIAIEELMDALDMVTGGPDATPDAERHPPPMGQLQFGQP